VPAGGKLLHEFPRGHADLEHKRREAAGALLDGEGDARAAVPVERAGDARAAAAAVPVVRLGVASRERGRRAARRGCDDGQRPNQRADRAERSRRLPDGGGRALL